MIAPMAAGARWLREEVIGSVEVQVPLRVELRKVTVEADVRSPGGTKPMRREYEYIPTRDAAAAFGEAYGEKVHHENVAERDRVQREIEQAQAQKRRIEARRRDGERRARNKSQVGTARRPKCAACDPGMTPCTESAACRAPLAPAAEQPLASEPFAAEAPVEKKLRWE